MNVKALPYFVKETEIHTKQTTPTAATLTHSGIIVIQIFYHWLERWFEEESDAWDTSAAATTTRQTLIHIWLLVKQSNIVSTGEKWKHQQQHPQPTEKTSSIQRRVDMICCQREDDEEMIFLILSPDTVVVSISPDFSILLKAKDHLLHHHHRHKTRGATRQQWMKK